MRLTRRDRLKKNRKEKGKDESVGIIGERESNENDREREKQRKRHGYYGRWLRQKQESKSKIGRADE